MQGDQGEEQIKPLSDDQQQLAADIMYTFMVKDAPQGVSSSSALIKQLCPLLEQDLKVSLYGHEKTMEEIAKQIVVPIQGVKFPNGRNRLFAIELESPELTQVRNAMVKFLVENPSKSFTKQEIINGINDQNSFAKKHIENMIKTIGEQTGKNQWQLRDLQI